MAKKQKAPAVPVVEVEVLPAEIAGDLAVAAESSPTLLGFLGGLSTFFREAGALERAAVERLARVKALAVPTDKAGDAAMMQEVRDARAARQDVEAKWEITSLVSKFHRRLTSARARATDPLQEAERHATRLHDAYVAAERRRAEEEQARERRRQEEAAQREREKSLEEHERVKLEAEAAMPDLSARETTFVDEYIRSGNAIIAATRAEYRLPGIQAPKLLASDKIRLAIEAKRTAAAMQTQIDAMKAMPVHVDEDAVKAAAPGPQLNKGDRYRWSATVVDLERFRKAAFEGGWGIPQDVFVVDEAKLNEYARALEQRIEGWPGVRARKSTTVL